MNEFGSVNLVKVADLQIDFSYQRQTDMARVRRIVAQFDPKLFDPITITYRDDAYWVVDGAHRLAAAKMLGIEMIPAILINSASRVEDAQLFGRKNSGQKKLTALERHTANVIAKDPVAVDIETALRKAGFKLGSRINCIGALTTIRVGSAGRGQETLQRTLTVIRAIVGNGKAEAWLVGSVGNLIGAYPQLDDNRLCQVMGPNLLTIQQLIVARAKSGGNASQGKAGREVLRTFYNGRRKTGLLE
ncbi:DUF6551 family protein [Streptomyces sp. NPDC057686]|uniref:DUF6551 family protein n=1 Tax=Streptomyces sp. NPDC057686 TaxID=3346212 RepID=UPI0036C7008E